MANTYLSRTFGTPTNANIWTYSVWIKRSQLGADQCFLSAGTGATDRTEISFSASDYIAIYRNIGGSTAGVETSELYRDTSGWYNLVFQNNSGTMTIYVNGETVTQNTSSLGTNRINQASVVHQIGEIVATGNPLNALMSHINFVDGTIYAPTAFGETDATTGEWKIKTSPSVTYGNNGFFILKDGNSVTDQSGNSNNFTVGGGTLTKTEDNPSNVFATMNPLGNYVAPTTLSQGNNTVAMTNSKGGNLSTLACTGGKYYSEMKIATMPQDSRFHIGILPKPISVADDPINTGNNGIMLSGFNAVIYANSGSGSASLNNFYGNATGRFSGTPILGCAVDLSSATKTMAISINGAWVTGSNTTDASFSNALKVDISTPVALEDDWFFGCGSGNGSGTTGVYNWNFGNGYFGTTAVSSAGTNASEIGIFEYDVPTGYTALSTKGLNL